MLKIQNLKMIFQLCEFLLFIQIIQNANGGASIQFDDNKKWLKLNSVCTTSTGASGLCKRPRECSPGNFKLKLEDICFFERKDPVVCCANTSVEPAPLGPVYIKLPDVNIRPNSSWFDTTKDKIVAESSSPDIYMRVTSSNKTTNLKCVEYQKPNSRNASEGVFHITFVGGELSKPKNNAQMAAIGWRSLGSDIDWKCGGSLISPDFVITAAHCAYDRGQPAEVVRVGDLNLLKNDNDTVAQNFNITRIFVHPNYKRGQMYHDIALFQITPDAKFNEYIKPGCLWVEPEIPVVDLLAMGYGTDAFAGRRTNELFEGYLSFVSNENCRQAFGTNFQIPNGIIESQMCAKDPAGKADTCQGDSGGPLLFRTGRGVRTVQHLVGITSFGESCAGPTPGVYTRISSYIDWIESIVWPAS